MLADTHRLFHTVRYLRLEQVQGRATRRLRRVRMDRGAAPALRATARAWVVNGTRRQSLVGRNRFTFLNETHEVASAADWNNPDWPRLWVYNLHYFDDLNADGAIARAGVHRALIERWVAENPPGEGAGWEPYCLSLRIVNWCKWAWQGHDLGATARQSLALQTQALMQQVETHLLGNHLLANAKALIFAGTFFAGEEADAWRRRGLYFLRREMGEQVLADGGHFELSPMYHSMILEDFLDLIQLAGAIPGVVPAAVVDDLKRYSRNMLEWLDVVTHPDGEIGFFNDAAFGVAQTPAVLAAYSAALTGAGSGRPAAGSRHLAESGLVRLVAGPAVLLADVGQIGPDHLPAHAHADTLSFELSLFGQRLFVNSGTSLYAVCPERLRQRGTAAHNTVVVDSADSSEVWSSFRVGRRARPGPVRIGRRDGALVLEGSHDGYRWLRGNVMHRRTWRLSERSLRVEDVLDGAFKTAVAYLRLHPEAVATPRGADAFDIELGGHTAHVVFSGGSAKLAECRWFPEFGKSLRCPRLALEFRGRRAAMELGW